MLRGAIAAVVTPLTADGSEPDEGAIGPLARFLAERGIDGVLACGTTGEGILLTVDERRRVAERFLEARLEQLGIFVPEQRQVGDDVEHLRELEILELRTAGATHTYHLTIPLMGAWIAANRDFEDQRRKARREAEELLP